MLTDNMFEQCARDRGEGDRFIVLGQVLVSFFSV